MVRAMRMIAQGGGTANPMIWVLAGPAGAHPMGFQVAQDVWDYLKDYQLDLAYNRKFIQAQLDTIRNLLDNPPPAPSVLGAAGGALPAPRWGSATTLGWTLGALAVATSAAFMVRRLRRTTPSTAPATQAAVDVAPEPEDSGSATA